MQLNKEQQEAVESLYGPLLVIAGAGSGKTRVVTNRIVNLLEHHIPPASILGLTFTNKAAGEMKERVRTLTNSHVLICTFHSLGARILRESIHVLGYQRNYTIYDEQDTEKLMKVCLSEIEGLHKTDSKDVLNFISRSKNALLTPLQSASLVSDSSQEAFPKIYEVYQKKLQECNALDFDDLLFLPVRLFVEHPEVLSYYQQRWSHLLIDEYQDTNEAQYKIVRHLVEKHNNICVVGDPDQSIYSWRGANVRNILAFEIDYPGAKVVNLQQNYRSRSNILNAANTLIENNTSRYEKNLWSDRGEGEKIKHFTSDTERSEAEFVSEKIYYYHEKQSIPLKQMAIFYRTNAQSRALEDRLLLHRIPYVIVGGISFYQRREIKDILAFLRLIQSEVDYVAFSRTINLPKRGIGAATIEKLRVASSLEEKSLLKYCKELTSDYQLKYPVKLSAKQKESLKSYIDILYELKEIGQGGSLKDLVTAAIERTGYLDYLKEEMESYQERKENLNALISKALESDLTLEAFLEELSLKSTLDESASDHDRVHLMTIHNGKGLEFEVVFLVGMEEDLFPHANSRDSEQALEEERRLCYVGMTRAKEYLYLCDVRARFLWGTTRIQRPSRFLREVPSKFVEKLNPSFTAKSASSYSQKESTFYPKKRENFQTYDEDVNVIEEPFSDEIGIENDVQFSFSPGDSVFDKNFGIGVIQSSQTGSLGLVYKILFSNDNRERSLVAKFCHLKKL